MSLATNVSDLATRIATEVKAVRTLLNGNAANNAALTTTAKGNLVLAINELDAEIDALSAGAAGIDDGTTATTSTWSSQKTSDEIGSASTADRARANHTGTQSADTVVDGTTNHVFTAADDTKLAGIATGATANATDAQLRDRATHTGTQASTTIANFDADVDARISAALDIAGAPALLNTINELAAAIGDDANFATTMTTALANRVRYDAAQSLTGPQQVQARANIDAASATDVGSTATNFVTTFEAGLV